MKLITDIVMWAEVWALIIPIGVLLRHRNQPGLLKPVVIYIWIALFLNTAATIIAMFHIKFQFPRWLQTNNYLYNIHSIARFICFSFFFKNLPLPFGKFSLKWLPILASVFLVINFWLFEDFFDFYAFSSRLLTIESGILLLYCLQYYLHTLRGDQSGVKRQADFWIVTGLSVYVVVNFFIFLFYTTLIEQGYVEFAVWLWNPHNISFIILCVFIAKAFHVSGRN